jgi:hypothetical protein
MIFKIALIMLIIATISGAVILYALRPCRAFKLTRPDPLLGKPVSSCIAASKRNGGCFTVTGSDENHPLLTKGNRHEKSRPRFPHGRDLTNAH